MTMSLDLMLSPFEFPARQEPAWASKVDRWSQLDAPAFGLADFYHRHTKELANPPAWILLASPGASNETDRQFAQTGARSPSKFVHTLPNIRSSALLRLMQWQGPVLCLQKDPSTFVTALQEAAALANAETKPIWVVGVVSFQNRPHTLFAVLGAGVSGRFRLESNQKNQAPCAEDRALVDWVAGNPPQQRFSLATDLEIVKIS